MLRTDRIRSDILGIPIGPWVEGAISLHRVPQMSGPLVAANLNDRELMVLWGLFHDERGWDSREWRGYHAQDAYTGFREFANWLYRRYSH